MSQARLAKEFGVDRKSVNQAAKRLREAGLITMKTHGGERGTSIFSLAHEAISPQACPGSASGTWGESASPDGAGTPHNIDRDVNYEEKENMSSYLGIAREVVDYLNGKTGKRFRPDSESHLKMVMGLVRDGYTSQDMKHVIDVKCSEWRGSDMERYLTPDTLFSPRHFDTYLNQQTSNVSRKETHHEDQQPKHESLDEYAGRF